MKYQKITIEVPALTDEAAAYLHKFIEALKCTWALLFCSK